MNIPRVMQGYAAKHQKLRRLCVLHPSKSHASCRATCGTMPQSAESYVPHVIQGDAMKRRKLRPTCHMPPHVPRAVRASSLSD
ncbi:hypothetical protein PIIN_10209 [Serendipita indica DSM 11827]|uniref:Uncharacterized protein n=1 Tax=Serendipita indica (strain DSM 11827) TaxID=1109443 RepID=G4TY23_SERID|nr:hypothetical protein PIIN_10209 [Serendipita indica DSM 11827]